MAGGLTHDFNNILGGVVGSADLLMMLVENETLKRKEDFESYLQTIIQAADRATDMIKQLMTLSRKHEISTAQVDLNLSVKNVCKICSYSFPKSITIKTEYLQQPAMIEADPTQIEQVLLNLCVNASHSMTLMRNNIEDEGGILSIGITIIKADKYFLNTHPEAIPNKEYCQISISDTGVGMEQTIINQIFTPFFTTKDQEKGSGLGLSMVYNIIKQHKGLINVYSEASIGSTFTIFLPKCKQETSDKIVQGNIKSALPTGKGQILVVDDEHIMRIVAEGILKECGYDVITAEGANEGLELFRTNHQNISMVLLDMAMPGKSGLEIYKEMKTIDPSCKILVVSGFSMDRRVSKVMEIGADGFLAKPYSSIILASKVKEIIG